MGHVRSQSASYTLSMPYLPELRNALYLRKKEDSLKGKRGQLLENKEQVSRRACAISQL
jgi:hypothetical protein